MLHSDFGTCGRHRQEITYITYKNSIENVNVEEKEALVHLLNFGWKRGKKERMSKEICKCKAGLCTLKVKDCRDGEIIETYKD